VALSVAAAMAAAVARERGRCMRTRAGITVAISTHHALLQQPPHPLTMGWSGSCMLHGRSSAMVLRAGRRASVAPRGCV
jgi:hypothetical protein